MRPPDLDRLGGALERIVGTPARIDALPSGTTGRSYLVETASGGFVAKAFAPESGALLGPAEQFELMRVLADAGICPRPIGFDRDARLLVTEFLDASIPLEPQTLRQPVNIERTIRCLHKLHRVTAEIPGYEPAAYARRYLSRAGGLMAMSRVDRKRYDELIELATTLEWPQLSVCHNDLLAENVLVDGDVRLIDFDYAVMGPPVLDLVSLVVMNGFSEREAGALLDAYHGDESRPPAAEFARVQRLVRLLAHFWALASGDGGAAIVAQYRISDD